jgi:ATP-binding cassette, subfamily B, multidrug efflux pump
MTGHDEEVLGKAYDARLMRRLVRYLRPYWRSAAVALVAILGYAALQLVPPYLTRRAIDVAIPAADLAGLRIIAAMYFATLLGEFTLEFIQSSLLQVTGQRIMFDLRMQIYRHLQRLDVQFYDRNPVGRLMTRVTTDVDALNDLFTAGFVSVFGDVFALLAIMAAMLVLDWRLALVAFAVIPLIALVTQWFRVHVRETYREVRVLIARINAFLQEHITGMATVQLFRREARAFSAFDAINRDQMEANLRSIFYYAVFYPAIEIVGAVATALILWFGGGRVVQDTLTLGTLVALIQYAQRFFRPIQDLSEKFNVLQGAMASSERIFQLLDTPVVIADPSAPGEERPMFERPPSPKSIVPVGIAFEHVWFAYNGDDYVLRDVSFVVEPGQRVGIVGATGAGKTTIINLILRFYDVTRGRITVNGVDIRELALADLRQMFGLVLQDVHLFSGTVAANIRLGDDAISDEAVADALRAVHADGFVDRLGGLDAKVAERGATLSVGQKQLLSFARALAFNPPVLLLDEATSSIDTETEGLIQEALRVLMRGRTTIAIAHRLSTIQDMDLVLAFHKGELRETGRHQELLAQQGIYRRLYELQYGASRVAAGSTRPASLEA